MKAVWQNKKNNDKLIVFFNGWAMDENAVKHLECKNFDVLIIYDYRDISSFNFESYKEKYLIAWSMGVMVCNLFYDILNNFDKKIAIAGTSEMINDNYGIPEKIYNLTIRMFNEQSKDKFMENMGFSNIKLSRSTEELKEELIALKSVNPNKIIAFDSAIVPLKDKIVPSKNQLNYWKNKAKTLDLPHYIFSNFKSWQEILCL